MDKIIQVFGEMFKEVSLKAFGKELSSLSQEELNLLFLAFMGASAEYSGKVKKNREVL